jgi:hypothetical protein
VVKGREVPAVEATASDRLPHAPERHLLATGEKAVNLDMTGGEL